MKGEGLWADLLRQRFHNAVRRLGLNRRDRGILDMSHFRRGEPSHAEQPLAVNPQLKLF
jgi:hypothetical protein